MPSSGTRALARWTTPSCGTPPWTPTTGRCSRSPWTTPRRRTRSSRYSWARTWSPAGPSSSETPRTCGSWTSEGGARRRRAPAPARNRRRDEVHVTDQRPPIGDGEPELPEDAGVTTDRMQPVDLQLEMQRSYLDYAMSVIVGRALPDVRDGLKPVHNRVLYAMYDGGYRPDRQFSKCSRVVGDVMGKYHPHGDTAIYDALVRLVQDWTLRYPLVQGQGNFGSPGNDSAAAPRYTECRMAPLAMEMVRDIDEDTVDFRDNYDGRTREPVVLPARFPNLLVNGSAGIAVGMATNIPPHNLREVADGVKWHLEHPEATKEELLEALISLIHGPDFPTGATILGRRGIEDAYRTGRGSITM